MKLTINGTNREIAPEWQHESLLFTLREHLGLIGAKFGCGQGQCGACTVIIDGDARRSCIESIADLEGSAIETLEGLGSPDNPHPLQQAWIAENVPQCGYCQAGQLMSAAALLRQNANPDDQDIRDAMSGNLCRCGTYPRIEKAIKRAAAGGL